MFSSYAAGFRAGKCPQPTRRRLDGTSVLVSPRCPFSPWRAFSHALWWSGYLDGAMKKLTQPIKRRA